MVNLWSTVYMDWIHFTFHRIFEIITRHGKGQIDSHHSKGLFEFTGIFSHFHSINVLLVTSILTVPNNELASTVNYNSMSVLETKFLGDKFEMFDIVGDRFNTLKKSLA